MSLAPEWQDTLWRCCEPRSVNALDGRYQVCFKDLLGSTHIVLAGGGGAVVVAVCVTTLITVVVLELS